MARRPLSDRPFDFWRSASGSVAVQAAFLMLLVLGFIALGVEASQLLLEQRKQQSAADSAAMAAAALNVPNRTTEARALTASVGYRHGVNNVAVSVADPPGAGAHVGDSQYLEVKVQQAVTPGIMQLFHPGSVTVQARSVALKAFNVSACLVALDTSSSGAIYIKNNAVVTTSACGLATNSASASAVDLRNNVTVNGAVASAGGVSTSPGVVVSGGIGKHASAVSDPYASRAIPARPSTPQPNAASTPSSPLNPGWYPNGWDFGNNANVTLNPGVYWIGTKLNFGNNATITGTGVTLIIDGGYAINPGNGATLNLTAPTSGTTAGILFYSSASNSSAVQQNFGNHDVLNLKGLLYFPSQTMFFDNNITTGASACTQVVARKIVIENNATLTFNSSCSGVGTSQMIVKINPRLAE
jgi:hypothetical protein